MTDSTLDGDPYQLASYQKHPKKARTDHVEQEDIQNKTETSLCIIFKKPLKSGTDINVAANVKLVMETMTKADPTLAVLGFDRQAVYHPSNNDFPSNEAKFKQFFLLHDRSHNPALKNQLTIGCILRSSLSIPELKNATVDTLTLLDWLTNHRVFIEADNLGHDNTKVVGFLLKVHPRIVHRDALKETLLTHLQHLPIYPQKVIDIDKSATDHYQHAMDSGDHIATYVPPFELFSTVISNTQDKNTVYTRTLGIKCTALHHALMRELLSLLFTKPPAELAHIQFSLSGIVSIIGIEAYRNLIRDNNKYFDNIATIPIIGVTNDHLDTAIHVADPTNPHRRMTLREIILDTPWCHNVETTKTEGRILLVTTKVNLQDARAWVDSSFEPLYTRYLPKNPRFWPHPDYVIPCRTDHIQTTATTNDYAAKLASSIPNHKPTDKDKDKFSKFPAKPHTKQPRYSFTDKQFPTINQSKADNQHNNNTSTTAVPANTTRTTKANKPATTTKKPANAQVTIHEQTQDALAERFMNMLSGFQNQMRQDYHQSFEKIDRRYDTLCNQVDNLNKQYQQLQNTINNMQAKHPSSSRGEDGHA